MRELSKQIGTLQFFSFSCPYQLFGALNVSDIVKSILSEDKNFGRSQGILNGRTFIQQRLPASQVGREPPVAFVCHAPAALIHIKAANGEPLVKGKEVPGFTNTEEEAVQLTDVVPFLLEDKLKNLGANYSKGADWSSYVKKDGLLITGQNPGSSEEAAKLLLETLKAGK